MNLVRRIILAAALMAGLAPAIAQSPTPVPALPDTERRTSYTISGSTCACAVNFALYGDAADYQNWVEVWINGVRANYNDSTVGWTITSPSGSLATLARPITDAVLTFTSAQTGTIQIVGARRPRRVSQFNENTGVSARNLNQTVTDIVAMLREDWDKINDVTGRAVLAPPGETINILASATLRANQGACFDSGGNLIACVSIPSSTFSAGNGIQFTGTNPTVIKNNIVASSPITITGTNPLTIACPTCNTSTTPNFAFMPTRTAAIAANLTGFTVVQTGAYATAGDGGGATFNNIGAAPFPEQRILTGSITRTGTGCTNGSYTYQSLSGGTGFGALSNFTVSGGVLTSLTLIVNAGGSSYSAGDVLSPASPIPGCSVQPQWTVSTVSSPVASFTDAAGNHWAYVPGTAIDARQFGYVADSPGSGSTGTNNIPTIQAALNFAATLTFGLQTNSGVTGATVILPSGIGALCGSTGLIIYGGTTLKGQGPAATSLHLCDSFSGAGQHIFTLCEPVSHIACFGARLSDLRFESTQTPAANANISVVYTNNDQQQRMMDNVEIYAGNRECLFYDTGFGGAAMASFYDVLCTMFPSSINAGITIAGGTTEFMFKNLIVEGSNTGHGMNLTGGQITVDGFHSEGIAIGIDVNLATSTHSFTLIHATGGSGCTNLVQLESTNTPGNAGLFDVVRNGCTNSVNDGQSGGSAHAVDYKPTAWNSFNP